MADTDAARIEDVKAGFAAVRADYKAVATAADATGAIVCTVTAGSTANAYVVSPRGTAVTTYQTGKLYTFVPDVTNGANPTLKIGAGEAKQLAEANTAAMAAGRIIPGRPVIVMYESSGAGYFRVAAAQSFSAIRSVNVGGTANAIVGSTPSELPALTAYSQQILIVLRLLSDATTAIPTLTVDGLGALGIYDSNSNIIDPRLLRAGNYLILRYSTAFGGLWQTVYPSTMPKAFASAAEGVQRADEAASGVRDLWSQLVTPPSLDPTPVYENTFSSSGDVTGFFSAKGTGPSSSYTESPLTHTASSGGSMVSSAVSTAGSDSWWWDWNHVYPGPGFLQLLLIANAASNASGPLPDMPDVRNRRVTFEIEAVDLYLPEGARLMYHWQGLDLSEANGGTGRAINFQWHEPLDVKLGSLGLGKGCPPHPNSGKGRLLNGTATYEIDFIPNDAFWRCLGTSEARRATYAFAPVERVMRAALTSGAASSILNDQIQVVQPQQWGHGDGPIRPPIERAYGELRIKSWKIEEPV